MGSAMMSPEPVPASPIAGGYTVSSSVAARRARATSGPVFAHATQVSGGHNVPTAAIALSTLCATWPQASVIATLDGTAVTAMPSVPVMDLLASSSLAVVCVESGSGAHTVSRRASVSTGAVTRRTAPAHAGQGSEGSSAGSLVQLASMVRTADTGVATVKASSPVR